MKSLYHSFFFKFCPSLFIILTLFVSDKIFAQIIPCETAHVACSNNIYSYPGQKDGNGPPSVGGYPAYGCLGGYTPGPAWVYMQVGVAGNITMLITAGYDVDFVCWGPFTSLTDGCATGLTAGKIVDCSFSASGIETCHILNAQVGEIYILLITNFAGGNGTITLQQTGGTGQTNCDIVVHCSMIAMTATPTTCNAGTNTFSISGNIEFSNPPPTGTLTLTDNTAVPPVLQTFTPPFISPLAYNLTNIPCDGLSHSLTAAFSDSSSCTMTQTVTSPAPSCPVAVMSGGGEICNNGTNTAPVNIALSGLGPFNFTYAINGIPQPPVTNYSGPSPYVINTMVPGTYTMISISNPICGISQGTASGTASVIVDPLPVPTLSGGAIFCSGSSAALYSTEPGMNNYLWNVSAGGTITAGGTSTDNTVTVIWNSAGVQTVSVNYHDLNNCTANSPVVFPVTVHSLPVPSISGTAVLCTGIPPVVYSTQPGMTNYIWNLTPGGTVTAGGTSLDNTITINWTIPGPNLVTVNFQDVNGCLGTPANYPVTVNPTAGNAGNITGSAILCQGSTAIPYSIPVLPFALSYNWTLVPGSAGTINGSTNSITIDWSAGFTGTASLSVSGTNNCGTGASSPVFPVLVNPNPIVSFILCTDTVTTINAKPFKLKGGIPLGGIYSGAGVNSGTSMFSPAIAGTGTHIITYTYTNTNLCNASKTKSILDLPSSILTCGSPLSDVRDNKVYNTIQIGTQCWMSEDLNYGIEIPLAQYQRDNCLAEKYTPHLSPFTTHSLYQWDEVMCYTETPADQGLCPPEWHVPSEADWTMLFNNYINSAFAGSPLKATGYSGFNALVAGINLSNRLFTLNNFAGFYWTSDSDGPAKAWSHAMNVINPSVSLYPSARGNAFSVRCIRD